MTDRLVSQEYKYVPKFLFKVINKITKMNETAPVSLHN